jgi:hypothetical protein
MDHGLKKLKIFQGAAGKSDTKAVRISVPQQLAKRLQ